ncbi:MAG: NAD-dependent epimerase/dehydratase family protein [Flavobacteriales bacterium]
MNLVTGATGILGSHLIIALLSRGRAVRALRRSSSSTALFYRLAEHVKLPSTCLERLTWMDGDVLDIPSLEEAMMDCTHMFHCAAVVSYHPRDRKMMYETNIEGTANVVNVALRQGGIRLCHVSSIAAIGKAKNMDHVDEESEWVESSTNTHYATTKHLSEMEVWRGFHEGLSGVIVNPGIIIGMGEDHRSSGSLIARIRKGISYYPMGGTGIVSASDCAEMMIALSDDAVEAERYILVSDNLSMKEVFQDLAKALNAQIPNKVATPLILGIARWAEWLKEKLTGKRALITAESARNTSLRYFYSNKKILEKTGLRFTPISETMADLAKVHQDR